jgi:leucyl-tRNA synthetase
VARRFFPIINEVSGSAADLKYYFNKDELTESEFGQYIALNQAIKAITEDFEQMQFHTAIAEIMKFLNGFEPDKIGTKLSDYVVAKLIQLISPLAPCMAEEMWEIAGYAYSIYHSEWPIYDPEAIIGDTIIIAVQVNGKLRGQIEVAADAQESDIIAAGKADSNVQKHTLGKEIIKEIYVRGRLVNLVVR